MLRGRLNRRSAGLLITGAIGTMMISLAASTALGAFTATVANNANLATSGTIVLHEGSSSTTCFSTAADAITSNANNCALNLFAGMTNSVPGGAPTAVSEGFANVGTANAGSFTLLGGACAVSSNTATSPYYGTDTGATLSLSSALSTGSAITSLPIDALSFGVGSGDALVLSSGSNSQVFTASAPAGTGATSIPVASQTPNFAYPMTAAAIDITQGFCGKVDVSIENDTTAGSPACVYPSGAGACPALSASHTLASLAGTLSSTPLSLGSLAAGVTDTLKFTVGLDSSATNSDQGLAASMPLTWDLSQ